MSSEPIRFFDPDPHGLIVEEVHHNRASSLSFGLNGLNGTGRTTLSEAPKG